MALDRVAEEIIESAIKEADGILAEAKRAAAEIIRSAEEQARAKEQEASEQAKKLADALSRKEFASARLEVKRFQLDAKKAALEETYGRLVGRISSLGEKEKARICKSLLSKADFEPGAVYANARDIELVRKLTSAHVKKADILGGLLAESREKTVRLDLSFDTALASLREDSLKEVSRRLFG